MTELVLMRHGAVDSVGRILGQRDIPLTASGWLKMFQKAGSLDVAAVFHSPAIRCQTYARFFAKRHVLPIAVEPELLEYNFGQWDGIELTSLPQSHPIWAFWNRPHELTPPDGERYSDFRARVNQALQRICEKYPKQRVLVVCHAGVIREILACALSIPLDRASTLMRIEVGYASITEIEHYQHDGTYFSTIKYINK